jgi:hypothetical protein
MSPPFACWCARRLLLPTYLGRLCSLRWNVDDHRGGEWIMAGRRTNLALLSLLSLALVTGVLAYAIGTAWVRWIVIAHGMIGLAILILAPWKSAIARRGLRRERPGRGISILLAVIVSLSLVTGVVHATGTVLAVGTFAPLGIHVATSIAAIIVVIAHVLRREVRPKAMDLSRRNALRAGALAAGAAAFYVGTESLARGFALPGADRRFTGSHERGSFAPGSMPVTQWFNDQVPMIDRDAWHLDVVVEGDVRSLSYEELAAFDDRVRAALDCTGGWYAVQDWEGARLDRLLFRVGESQGILVRSITGYGRRFPARDASRMILATRVGGEPLSAGHGSPLRLVAPGRRGFWWVKWVTSVEVDGRPWWWQPPFPLT